jgi:hypothetical protein
MGLMKDGRYTIGSLCKCRHTHRKHINGKCCKCDCKEFRYTKGKNKMKSKQTKEQVKEDNVTLEIGRILFKVGLSGLKSFVFALSQVVWMFAGVLLMGASILYLIKSGDVKTMTEIPKGVGILLDIFKNYWNFFFIGIWIFDFIINFRDINKD